MSSGLTSAAAQSYLDAHGYNEIAEHKDSLFVKILRKSFSPISGMLLIAAGLSFLSGKFFDCTFILILLLLNIGITVWQEHKADTAIEKLNEHLAAQVRVLRDAAWKTLSSRLLVPKDVIELRSGSVVPADAVILQANNASANEAALTGESLPKDKKEGDELYSGSFVASGLITAEVTATGSNTRFGKTLQKTEGEPKKSLLEQNILRIARFLSILSLVAVALLSLALFHAQAPILEILRLDLSLVIAGIPVSLPTVMTLIIAFGVIVLAKKDVAVRRLSSLEDLANADFLLTDKTGTLTQNEIRVDEIVNYDAMTPENIGKLAALVASQEGDTALGKAIVEKGGAPYAPSIIRYTPADSTRKRSTLTLMLEGAPATLSLGAPQVILSLCAVSAELRERFTKDIDRLAEHGYRALALARAPGDKEENMELLGTLSLSDVLRPDAKKVIQFLDQNGIGVAMVTGDNKAIAQEIARKLDIPGSKIVSRDDFAAHPISSYAASDFLQTQAFAEILPEDKFELVKAAKRFYTVAANGDGVNDLPAVREADVGFAVKNAVDALKGAADIVLLSDGIAVMRDAFIEGRKIFARLYSYSLYRISESFRLIITIAALGFLTGTYPLSPLQLILIALLNDIPIISLAFNRVRIAHRPSTLNVREQFSTSLLFGMVGVVNSLLLYFLAVYYLHLPMPIVQTLFFLKLTVSGHLLIYVAHTKARWYRYLPSRQVIIATMGTQLIATAFAITGFLMPAGISWQYAVFIWLWSFFFMQVSEAMKWLRHDAPTPLPAAPQHA